MGINHRKANVIKKGIEITTEEIKDINLSAEQKNTLHEELNELKDIHNEHVNFHVKKDEEKIDAMPDGEEKKEAKVKLEDFKSNYVLEANSTENASKKDSNTSTKSNATKTSSTKSSSSEGKETNSTSSKKNTDDSNSNYTESEIKKSTQICIKK